MLAKFVPEILTVVPPAEVPLLGVTEVMLGLTAESVFIVRSAARVPVYVGVQEPFAKPVEVKASIQSALIVVIAFD